MKSAAPSTSTAHSPKPCCAKCSRMRVTNAALSAKLSIDGMSAITSSSAFSAANGSTSLSRQCRSTSRSVRSDASGDTGGLELIGVPIPSAEQRRAEHRRVQVPAMKRPPTQRTREPHLGGTEQQLVDLVEVALVALEDLVERRAVVRRRRSGHLR